MTSGVKLTDLQKIVLEKAAADPDGAHLYGASKYAAADSLQRKGLVQVFRGYHGLRGRACITPAGRALLASDARKGE